MAVTLNYSQLMWGVARVSSPNDTYQLSFPDSEDKDGVVFSMTLFNDREIAVARMNSMKLAYPKDRVILFQVNPEGHVQIDFVLEDFPSTPDPMGSDEVRSRRRRLEV